MTDHQHRLTAAREAVVEAAKEWDKALPDDWEAQDKLRAAVAHLLEVESEHG